MLGKAKDKMIATAAKRFLEGKLGRYGKLHSFTIDSKTHCVLLEFLPAGDPTPVLITINRYRVVESGDGVLIRIEDITADRLWVAHLLEDYVNGLEIPLKGAAAKLVDWLL